MSEPLIAYISPTGFEHELADELKKLQVSLVEQRKRLFLCRKKENPADEDKYPVWAQNIWLEPAFIASPSINLAARQLKSLQRNWACHPTCCFRRCTLINEKLPRLRMNGPLTFGNALPEVSPSHQLGAWTLWDEGVILASRVCSSRFPDGEVRFHENKNDPPGRAYLKLWEALTRLGLFPRRGETALDLGSSPGGWTWALASLGAEVISVDKAPLAENVASMPGVRYLQGSAFGLSPHDFPEITWLCSDVICYPQRLYRLVMQWLEAGYQGNIVCTLKFQGETDFASIELFKNIPGGKLLHLAHNKHELTWIRPADPLLSVQM
ncbi:MAG: hypothetical protein IJD04_04180 [Desulfovibrionaceae bacterium]|nr:hypothetical protein [Desulfovibrionaceae bacterium]